MERIKTIESLKSCERETLSNLIGTLNVNHIISDDDLKGLSSAMIENWSEECDEFLRDNGYTGEQLRPHGKYYSAHGAIYVVCDESKISYEEATEYIKDIVRRDVES